MSGLLEEEEVEEDDEALFVLGRCDRAGARSCCRARWHANRRETARLCWSRRHGAAVAVRAALLLLMSALLLVALLGERSASFLRTYSWCTFLGETVALLLLLLATLLSRPRLAAAAALAFQSALPHALTVTLAYWTLIAKPHNFALSEVHLGKEIEQQRLKTKKKKTVPHDHCARAQLCGAAAGVCFQPHCVHPLSCVYRGRF
jgi:hypothetical protein